MYFLFQTIGAFFGASIIFGMYYGKDWLQWTFKELRVSIVMIFMASQHKSPERNLTGKKINAIFLLHFASFKMPCSTFPELSICLEKIPQLESLLRTPENILPLSTASLTR